MEEDGSGVPLATDETMTECRKRGAEAAEVENREVERRQRLEALETNSCGVVSAGSVGALPLGRRVEVTKREFDVSEIFSPPRVAEMARKQGLRGATAWTWPRSTPSLVRSGT